MEYYKKRTEINVLCEFKRYLPLLTAYNSENSGQSNRNTIKRSIFYAFCGTLIPLFIALFATLATWYLIEKDANLKEFVASLPLTMGLVNNVITSIALMIRSRDISESIAQMNSVVNQREYFCLLFCLFLSFVWLFLAMLAILKFFCGFFLLFCAILAFLAKFSSFFKQFWLI